MKLRYFVFISGTSSVCLMMPEINTKYHNFNVIFLILTYILSYQDGIIVRSLFLPLYQDINGENVKTVCIREFNLFYMQNGHAK